MKFYETPIADIILLDVEDILTASSLVPDNPNDPAAGDNLGE